MSNIVIDIAAEFTGNKAFKQAESATDKLGKQAKKLAAAFGLGLSATAVLAYGKAAVKAAVADEKAQKQLALALKNVGLGRDAAASEEYIQRIQSEFGIVDDLLRPAYQTLAVATRDSAESQRLLNLALDISASTGKDLGSVTSALSRAYLGNNTSLSKLGVGISKADLKTKSFLEVTEELAKTFAGAATESANSLAGQMAKLEVASANVQEILGKGIIDSLIILSGNTTVDELAMDMETAATNAAAFLKTVSEIVRYLNKPMMAVSGSIADFVIKTDPFVDLIIEGDPSGFMKKKVTGQSGSAAQGLTDLARLQFQYASKTLTTKKKITQEENKTLKIARSKAALDKAAVALSKGEEVFDMEKIQNEAALKNQAEQLGKATNGAQILQIANDTARLNVKKSILALEDAMATKDEAAIKAATAKLNADLGILGALTGQDAKLVTIKSILDSLKPKDLINLDNLREALALLKQIALGSGSTGSTLAAPSMPKSLQPRPMGSGYLTEPRAFTNEELKYFEDVSQYQFGGSLPPVTGSSGTSSNTIIVNTGIGDPNAIAEAIDQVLTDAVQRGTLRGTFATQ
jgi:hypothetical protein